MKTSIGRLSVLSSFASSAALADWKGTAIVLEWVDPGCPFVRKHHDAQNMQATQRAATGQGVVWLAINSTARSSAPMAPARRRTCT